MTDSRALTDSQITATLALQAGSPSPRPCSSPPKASPVTESSRPASPADGDDAAVEAEWRSIEAERIAQEQEEAREVVPEVAGARGSRQWLWLALVASLGAGVLVAGAVNWLGLRHTPTVTEGPDRTMPTARGAGEP